jgi:uncharacterized paraquat-inducible protein A
MIAPQPRSRYCISCETRVVRLQGLYCARCELTRRDAERASLSGGIVYLVIAVLFLVAVTWVCGGGW